MTPGGEEAEMGLPGLSPRTIDTGAGGSLTGAPVRNADSRALPRPSRSETLAAGPRNLMFTPG